MELQQRLTRAIRSFWTVRRRQGAAQGQRGARDQGARSQVTGGAQMDGLAKLVRDLLKESGVEKACIHTSTRLELPGYFRPTKQWDLIVVRDGKLLACVEFKSQVGSFGNNFNNRTEEALGNAVDLWRAYEKGKFQRLPAPWMGYLFLLEEADASTKSVSAPEPHFSVFPEFKRASYQRRYELFCERLIKEKLYNGACFLMSSRDRGLKGAYTEPVEELSFKRFVGSLIGYLQANG
jgi:hypothetical protein